MKRVGYKFEKVYDIENLKLAHKNARKGKTKKDDVLKVDENEKFYLEKLQRDLKEGMYKTSKYNVFYKKEGRKTRKIYELPYYPDRIAQ